MPDDSYFVVIEGVDGAGKTSIARRLHAILHQTFGDKALLTEEPHDDSLMGAEIRAALGRKAELSPTELALAFALNRSHHLRTVIEPWLAQHQGIVICDRYLLSSLVYQTRGDIEMADVYRMNRWARQPDLTIVLQVQAHIAYQRMDQRGRNARELFENDLPTRLRKYRAGIELLRGKGQRVIEAPGDGDLPTTLNEVLNALKREAPDWLRIQAPLLLS